MKTYYLLKLALLTHNEALILYVYLYTLFLSSTQQSISKTMLIKYFILNMWFLQ